MAVQQHQPPPSRDELTMAAAAPVAPTDSPHSYQSLPRQPQRDASIH